MSSRINVSLALAGALALMLAAPAGAAITGSQVTLPATSPSFIVYDQDNPSDLAVAGTTTGGNPAVDRVDLICTAGGEVTDFEPAVALNPDGSFSAPAGDLNNLLYQQCRLRAVPADLSPYAGPLVEVSYRRTFKVGVAPNADTTYNYYVWAQQPLGAFDYVSASSCGVDDGYLFDETLARTTTTFYCNAFYDLDEGAAGDGTRSELRIDGANAYGPAATEQINSAAGGLPATIFSFSQNPANGDSLIQESSPLVKCPDPGFPATATTCPSFLPTGVRHDRTISQDHQGRLATISDSFVSVDGQQHQLDLLWQNHQRFYRDIGDSTRVEYQFPGQSAFAAHSTGDIVPLPAGPGTIFVRMGGAADGDKQSGQGAIVYDRSADLAGFNDVDADSSGFFLHQTATVPAGGSAGFRFAYVQAYLSSDVTALARAASDPFAGPAVRITSPRNGRRTFRRAITVRGTASDNAGVAELTVNGKARQLLANGRWSAKVRLRRRGRIRIVAVATDAAGNSAQARIDVRRTRACTVPKLKGKTLRGARRALRKAHCRLGKVRSAYSGSVPAGRVIASKRKRGRLFRPRTRIGLTLSRGPRP
jgi:Glucodextranase, domain B